MSMPHAWIDRLFTRLTVRYGVAFIRQYESLDIAVVKEDWAEVLSGFDGEAIGYALRYLPADKPPTALLFRDQCRRAPRKDDLPALQSPPPDPARVKALKERMALLAERLKAEPMRPSKIGAESDDGLTQFDGGAFSPIPPELCPWNRTKAQV